MEIFNYHMFNQIQFNGKTLKNSLKTGLFTIVFITYGQKD